MFDQDFVDWFMMGANVFLPSLMVAVSAGLIAFVGMSVCGSLWFILDTSPAPIRTQQPKQVLGPTPQLVAVASAAEQTTRATVADDLAVFPADRSTALQGYDILAEAKKITEDQW